MLTRKSYITPILDSLHWLPVKFRIHFKIILIAYKVLPPIRLTEYVECFFF